MSVVSVIIPLYNAERTIEETLRSVLDQTFLKDTVLLGAESFGGLVFGVSDSRPGKSAY